MPSAMRYSRALTSSPPPSTSSSHAPTTVGGTSHSLPPKIVTRLAVEGKVKNTQDGPFIRMYLKMAIPVENAIKGKTIHLFPEENIKILRSQVHPLDNSSAPYNFNSQNSPLLSNAARALNLPARSSQAYMSQFTLQYSQTPPSISSSRASSSNGAGVAVLEEKYTGHITVSDYQVAYVLPMAFPTRPVSGDSEDPRMSPTSSRKSSRRGSVGERPAYQFMAAIDMVIPLLTKPPRAPYLLSIPVPRCLSNTLDLRISPPTTGTANSQASLSSADEDSQWNFTCHPQLTRGASRHSRSGSYPFTHFADDESSDSSTTGTTFSESNRLQGTFQSTDKVRIRWARAVDLPVGATSGRRRVGVSQANGDLTVTVLGKGKARDDEDDEGTLVRLEYSASCTGVWYSGVATMLGLDVSAEARDCEIKWAKDHKAGWSISGEAGYTGWDQGEERATTVKKPFLYADVDQSLARARVDSTSSTSSSLLRQPLPGSHLADISIDSTFSTPMSSTSSLPPPSPGLERSITPNGVDAKLEESPRPPPGVPITLHVNMDDLTPDKRTTVYKFTITGTLVILPRLNLPVTPGRPKIPLEETSLPRISVLAASSQIMTTLVRNEATGFIIDVISGDDLGNRKSLSRGAHTRCSGEGSRIVLRSAPVLLEDNDAQKTPQRKRDRERSMSRPTTPRRLSSASVSRDFLSTFPAPSLPLPVSVRPKRNGPLMIPHVDVQVDLFNQKGAARNEYAVRIVLPAPEDEDSEWLEFGLSLFGSDHANTPHAVRFACASVGGVPVAMDIAEGAIAGNDKNGTPTVNSQKWFRWVKIHTAGRSGELVRVDYMVYPPKDKEGAKEGWPWEFLLLPVFTLPVGPYEVTVEKPKDCTLDYRYNAFTYHHNTLGDGMRFRAGRVPEYFEPRLTLGVGPAAKVTRSSSSRLWNLARAILPQLLTLFLILTILGLRAELQDIKDQLGSNILNPTPPQITAPPEPVVETVTIINTHYTHPPWASEEPVPPVETPPAPSAAAPPSPSIVQPSAIPEDPSPTPVPTLSAPTLSTVVLSPRTTVPPPDRTRTATHALIPVYVPFSWVPRMEWDVPTAEDLSRTVMSGLGQVWQVVRRMYHYPLPPP